MESKKFAFDIKINDETGIWQVIWNNLKDHLNSHFIPLSYKENNNTKSLANLNIKLSNNTENANFTIFVFRLNSLADLKPNVKENIIKNIQNEKVILPIMLMEIENTESALKSSLKVFEKIKSELKLNFIKLLPINVNHLKLSDLINDFFRELKNRISFDISKMFFTYSSNIDNLKLIKIDNKENTYCYIANKDNLIQLLQVAEFYSEIIKICEADINSDFKYLHAFPIKIDNKLNKSCFNETFSLIDYNEDLIKNKIEKKILTNIDYQIYLFHLIIHNYKQMREFKKLYHFVFKFLNNINNLKSFFLNVYYYNFWCIDFIGKIIPFYKTIKSNYLTPHEEELNLKARNQILYLLKKSYKSFSKLLNLQIPNSKIFKILANNYFYEDKEDDNKAFIKETNHLEISFENQLEKKVKNYVYDKNMTSYLKNSDENYINFINDINKNLDEKSKGLVLSKEKFFEEYLNIIRNLEKSHIELKEKRLVFRLQLEKLPILFSLGKFSEMKNLLVDNLGKIKLKDKFKEEINDNWNNNNYMTIDKPGKSYQNPSLISKPSLEKELEKEDNLNRWPLLKEYVCSLLILLLNSLDKSTENIRIIIDILNIYQSNDLISNYFDLEDKNVIKNILTKYLDDKINVNYKHSNSNNSYSALSNGERENFNNLFKINLNEIIDFNYSVVNLSNKTNENIEKIVKSSSMDYKNIFFLNKENTKNLNFNLEIFNKTDLEMKITSITIHFFDQVNNNKFKYDHFPIINGNEICDNKDSENNENSNIFIIKGSDNTNFKLEIDINNLDKIKNLSISSLVINKIYLYLTWGILGIFKFKNADTIIYLKNNDFEVNSNLHNFLTKNNKLIEKLSTYNLDKDNQKDEKNTSNNSDTIFLNIDNPLYINFSNMKNFNFSEFFLDINLKLVTNSSHNQDGNHDLIRYKSNLSNNDNEVIKSYIQEESNIKLDILKDIEIIYFNKENNEDTYHYKNANTSFFLTQPKENFLNERNSIENSNLDLENIKSETNTDSKEKNIKIFDREYTDKIITNSYSLKNQDLFNKYILKHQNNLVLNNNIKSIDIDKRFENHTDEYGDFNIDFVIVLHLLFSDPDFNSLSKQNIIIQINIRKIEDYSILFETKEEYEFKLQNLFNVKTKSILKKNTNKDSVISKKIINSIPNNYDLDEKSNSEASQDSFSANTKRDERSPDLYKNDLFILSQNSISLNKEITNISLMSNTIFNCFLYKQVFEIINKIPFDFKELRSMGLYSYMNDLKYKNNLTFKDVFFYFKLNESESKENESKFKNESFDNFISGDIVSNNSYEENFLKKNINKISDILEYNRNENSFKISKFRFFFPINSLIGKLEEISYIEYFIDIKLQEKIPNKTENKSKSILHDSSQKRTSIANTFLNSLENYTGNDIQHLNSSKKESEKRLSFKMNNNINKIFNPNLPIKSKKHSFEIYKEISVLLNIKHLHKKKTYFMIQVKEDNNWTTVGKSRIIEKFNFQEIDKSIVIKLIPLQDGYIKLPEFEFSDFQAEDLDQIEKDRKDSVNHMEFIGLNKNSVCIEGNEKILKINPVKQTSIKVNVI